MSGRLAASFVFVVLVGAAPASAGVSVGHSGWFWGNPTPQGNTLHAVEFDGATGYAAGEFGTLVRSADAGATWAGLATGLTDDLSHLEVIDAASLIVGSECALRRSDDSGESFRRLPFTSSEQRCTRRVVGVSFVSRTVGMLALENGTVLATADGGNSFSPRAPLPGTSQAGGNAEPTAILLVTADRAFAATSGGRLFRTTNGGGAWSEVFTVGSALRDIFIEGSSGVAVGDNGAFVTTDDGGATWRRTPLNSAYSIGFDLRSVECSFSSDVCLMGGDVLSRTDDNGSSFELLVPFRLAPAFVNDNRVVAVGFGGATTVSDDGGETFRSISRMLNVTSLGRMRATSPGIAHVPGARGALARTVDGGETWVNIGVATSETVRDTSFPSAELGYALDTDGGLFRTGNGGASWGILDTGTSARPRAVLAPDAIVVLLVGPTGVRRSIDSGDSFAPVQDGDVRSASLFDVDRAGSAVMVFGRRKIAVSGNRGRTWRSVRLPRRRRSIVSADFVSPRTGYVLLNDGRVFSTRDGGRRWRELLGVANSTGAQLAFGDSTNGWLLVNDFPQEGAYVLRTSNGGASWRPQLLGEGAVRSIAAGGTAAAFAHLDGRSQGSETRLLATGSGGDRGRFVSLRLTASRKRLSRPRRVTISGRLGEARGGERVVIASRRTDRTTWGHVTATVARGGTFSIRRRLARTTVFVAQWRGDEERAGAASRPLTVRVRRAR